MRLSPHEVAIGILGDEFEEGIFPNPYDAFEGKDGALEFLRDLTEEDFGLDCAQWRKWFDACPDDMLRLHYDEWEHKEIIARRPERLQWAENRWQTTTTRRCPECGGLCPEYRRQCWVCRFVVGRILG